MTERPRSGTTTRVRPRGVTFAANLSLVYGAVAGLLIPLVFTTDPPDGILIFPWGVWYVMLMAALVAGAAIFLTAGVGARRGRQWARWILVVLYGMLALTFIGSFFPGVAIAALNATAAILLLRPNATTWFKGA